MHFSFPLRRFFTPVLSPSIWIITFLTKALAMSCSDIPACWQNVQFGFVLIFSDFSDGAVSNDASADVITSSETIQTQNVLYIAFGMLYNENSYIDDQLESNTNTKYAQL